MATRNTKLTVDITADDNASRVIRDVKGEARELDDIDPEIEVSVDDNASGKIDALSGSVKGLAAGVGVGSLAALAGSAADAALSAETLASLTGTSLENASRLQTVFANTADVDANDLLDIILQMNVKLLDSPELVADLGIEYDASKPAAETFIEVVDALNESQLSQNEKVALMAELFGEEGVRQVGRVITTVGDLSDAVDNVPDLAVVDERDVERAKRYQESWADFKTSMQELGLVVLPAVSGALDILSGLATSRPGLGEAPVVSELRADVQAQIDAEQRNRDRVAAAGLSLPGVGPLPGASNVTIINPPGTPAATAVQYETFVRRNGGFRE